MPQPISALLEPVKSLTSVQFVPFHVSVLSVSVTDGIEPVFPPKANAAVYVPDAPNCTLAVLKSFTSVQLVPSQDSVFATVVGPVVPPIANEADLIPVDPK